MEVSSVKIDSASVIVVGEISGEKLTDYGHGHKIESRNDHACLFCGDPAVLSCGFCKIARYCTKEHQKKHWKVHRNICCPIRVERPLDMNLRRHNVLVLATRDIQQGETILSEEPLILLPFVNADSYSTQDLAYCVNCYKILTTRLENNNLARCNRCRFPVCGKECAADNNHISECHMISLYEIQEEIKQATNTTAKSTLLICLIRLYQAKAESGRRWKTLVDMAGNTQPHLDTQEFVKSSADVVIAVATMFGIPGSPDNAVAELRDILVRFHPLLLNRAFLSFPDSMVYAHGHLYEIASMFRHACIPNAMASTGTSGRVNIKASEDIKKGSEISLAKFGVEEVYLQFEALQHVIRQNRWLHSDCDCATCQAPQSIHRLTNAHKCDACQSGYLVVPTQLLSMGDIWARWNCNSCTNSEFTTILKMEIFTFEETYRTLRERIATTDYNCLEPLSAFIEHLQCRLHRHHYLLMRSMNLHSVSRSIVEKMGTLDLLKTCTYQKELLSVYDAVAPGINVGRGLVLFKLHQICEYLVLRAVLRAETEESWDSPEIIARWKEMQNYLKEAQKAFAWRKDCIQGDELHQVVACLERHSSTNKTPFLTCLSPRQIMANVKGARDDPAIHSSDLDPKENSCLIPSLYERLGTFYVVKEKDFKQSMDRACVDKLEKFFNLMKNTSCKSKME